MKNILNATPSKTLMGRLSYTFEFVSNSDLKNKKILDIGCGFGWFELNVNDYKIKEIIGTEISRIDLLTAKQNVKNKKTKFVVGTALDIPFPDNYFDTVVAWDVLEHIPRNMEIAMFEEVSRVLVKKGVFYLSTPNRNILSTFLDPAWWFVHHRHYKKNELFKYGKKTDFSVIKYVIKGNIFSIVAILDLYISKWLFRRKPFFENLMAERENLEYLNKNGFVEIFIKYKKKR